MDQDMMRLIEIVGDEGVFTHPQLGETSPLEHKQITNNPPSFLIKPKNVDEVHKIVLWANETRTPLVPVSSGGPHFRGDTIRNADLDRRRRKTSVLR